MHPTISHLRSVPLLRKRAALEQPITGNKTTDTKTRILKVQSGRVRIGCLELLCFAVLALFTAMPTWENWNVAIPLGSEHVATVPLFNAWTIGWNSEAASRGYQDYWNAPFYYPLPNTFALCEAQPLTVLAAPLQRQWSLATAYNTLILVALTLNGWCAAWLLSGVGIPRVPAILGGLLMLTLPFTHWQLGVLQLVPVWGILVTLVSLWKYRQSPSTMKGVACGLAFTVTHLMCNYYGLFLSLLLAVTGVFLINRRMLKWKTLGHVLTASVVAGALLFPATRAQLQADREWSMSRDIVTIHSLSAHPTDFLTTVNHRLPGIAICNPVVPQQRAPWPLGMGTLAYSLAILGVCTGLFLPDQRRWTMIVLVLALASFLFAQGPRTSLWGWSPYSWLMEWYPGLSKVRSPFRFTVFFQIAIVLLAAQGAALMTPAALQKICSWCRIKAAQPELQSARWKTWLWSLPLITVTGLTLYETWPHRSPEYLLPQMERHRGWCTWLVENATESTPIVCFPFPTGRSVEDYLDHSLWMYLGLQHQRPIVNGYAGYFPERFHDWQTDLSDFPDQKSLEALEAEGVSLCVIRHDFQLSKKMPPAGWSWQQTFTDPEAGIDVYRIVRKPGFNEKN